MERWKAWPCLNKTFLFSAKCMLLKLTSRLRAKSRGNHGLVGLYKDMESCGEYTDIQVMWDMIHSSCSRNDYYNNRKKKSLFQPNMNSQSASKVAEICRH